jgi:hypothetical protein
MAREGTDTVAASRGPEYTPEQVFYAAACAFAERSGVEPRYVELFREDVADPEAVDTLADRDPGFRVSAAGRLDPASFVAQLSGAPTTDHFETGGHLDGNPHRARPRTHRDLA